MENKKIQTKNNNEILQWTFSESLEQQRPHSWYVWLGVISGGLLIYSVFTFNFLFAAFIVLTDIIIISTSKKNSNEINAIISRDGISIGNKFYPYRDLGKFWIIYQPPTVKTLYFEFKNRFKPLLSIPLKNQNPVETREILTQFLIEDLEQEKEPLNEQIKKFLKL